MENKLIMNILSIRNNQNNDSNNINEDKLKISCTNEINVNPPFKNDISKLKKYFNNKNKYKRKNRRKSNSLDMPRNTDSKFISDFQISRKKLSFDSPNKANVNSFKINCYVNEPYKTNFSIIIGKKAEMSLLKKIIHEQLVKKNNAYKDLNIKDFSLMKNYSFVREHGNVEDSKLSDGDDIYIILSESMDKC